MAAKQVYYFGDGDAEDDESMHLILGVKGANLAQMAKKPLSLTVPSGFTISIDICQEYYKLRRKYPDTLAPEVTDLLIGELSCRARLQSPLRNQSYKA